MFSTTSLRVKRAIFLPFGRSFKSSVTRTISLASIAASEPTLPIDTAQSAAVITGASFIPSPAYSSLPRDLSSCAASSLPSGNKPALKPSRPAFSATACARAALSPVSIQAYSIPDFLSSAIACAAPSFRSSSISINPIYSPSDATNTRVERLWVTSKFTPFSFKSAALPQRRTLPLQRHFTPLPAISSASVIL